MKNSLQSLIIAVSLVLGLLLLGICINKGLQSFSNKERVVTVKGLAEKEIKATSARVAISYDFSGDDPKELLVKINNHTEAIENYLKSKNYSDFSASDMNLYDSKSYYDYDYVNGARIKVKKDRYRVSKSISMHVAEVEQANDIGNTINIDLINKNLSSDISVSYGFPELNEVKPQLIAESTKNARVAGEQFAKDSQSQLGKIKTASQGQISIAGSYYDESDVISSAPAQPYMQKARVVSTIVFFLED
ncbi:MAG: SIMPL domain-containing protein [Prevotellaceae bacterium]|jgi:hypothetical protein|nr:SIMPL domain-containing protein [Prevotellaceae bacterium]